MSASTKMACAFDAWRVAELAAHYADPCPDEIMDDLTDRIFERYLALATLPAETAEELLFKIFPLLLTVFEPKLGDDPLMPKFDPDEGRGEKAQCLFNGIIADLKRVSPTIADVMAAPHPSRSKHGPRHGASS